jgi:hypothetical protein
VVSRKSLTQLRLAVKLQRPGREADPSVSETCQLRGSPLAWLCLSVGSLPVGLVRRVRALVQVTAIT